MIEIPYFGLRAYALFYAKHGLKEAFSQSELDWSLSQSMKKKIFSVLLRAGWIKKVSRKEYNCIAPDEIFKHLLDFKVNELIKKAEKPYAFTESSAVEIWSDYSYVQRSWERSPYFIKVLKKDLKYWKTFFNKNHIPNYIKNGTNIGEFVILIAAEDVKFVEKNGLKVEPLKTAMKQAKDNEMFAYAYIYMKNKYGEIK